MRPGLSFNLLGLLIASYAGTVPKVDLTANLISYYGTVVEPIRKNLLKAKIDSIAALDSAMDRVIDDAVFPRHRRPERPIMLYLGWLLAGGTPESSVPAQAAIAGEFLHSGSLIHDDVVDESAERNWQKTVWASHAAQHSGQPWAASHGRNVAIWLGDLLMVWAHDIFAETLLDVPSGAAKNAKKVWTQGTTEVLASQYLDLAKTANALSPNSEHIQAARTVAKLKGQYVAALPLELGAALAGGSPALMSELRHFGQPLGEAYVYRNDLEGVFGDEAVMDSTPHDLREQRLSLLLALAEDRASSGQKQVLRKAGRRHLNEQEMLAIKAVIVETGARSRVEALSHQLGQESLAVLDKGTLPGWAKQVLTQFVLKSMSAHHLVDPMG